MAPRTGGDPTSPEGGHHSLVKARGKEKAIRDMSLNVGGQEDSYDEYGVW